MDRQIHVCKFVWTVLDRKNAEKGSNFYFKGSLNVFHESMSRAPKYSSGAVLNYSKIRTDIRGGMFITGEQLSLMTTTPVNN
jgi:hypothetical protein